MSDFKAPLDDILFTLRHIADAPSAPGWDDDVAADIITHFAGFAEGVIAPLNATGDATGARLENGRVRMPNGFQDAFRQLAEDGWQGLTAPVDFGGMGQSALIGAAVSEIFSGANHALQMVCNLVPGAIKTLINFGTPDQQATWIPRLTAGEVLSTMCLTEAGAGSDLSQIRCKAEVTGDHWTLHGEKIFISGGDQDMSEGILHFVLARSGTPDSGIKGLSLFLCPAGRAVQVTRIEEKLGLHASPTCQMVFNGARAELIGVEGEGLRAMFTVMNHARIDVALQGVAHAARAAQIASIYAAERIQGRKSDGTAAALSDHADVTRMLNEQASLAIGARAMCYITLGELERDAQPELVEFLTSLCKVFASEAGIKAADLGIQILGGYGYLNEYPIAQTWRDARITAIYEGANGIHERSIATRGLHAKGGADAFEALIETLAGPSDALDHWRSHRAKVADAPDPDVHAHQFAQATAQLFFNAVWAKIAAFADHHPNPKELKNIAYSVLN